jgi:hypothetical protein
LGKAWRKHGRLGEEAAAGRALASYCHTVMNSGAFLTID